MNSAVAINARIFTSIISSFFYFIINNSGSDPIEILNLYPVNSMGEIHPDDIESDQYHWITISELSNLFIIENGIV